MKLAKFSLSMPVGSWYSAMARLSWSSTAKGLELGTALAVVLGG